MPWGCPAYERLPESSRDTEQAGTRASPEFSNCPDVSPPAARCFCVISRHLLDFGPADCHRCCTARRVGSPCASLERNENGGNCASRSRSSVECCGGYRLARLFRCACSRGRAHHHGCLLLPVPRRHAEAVREARG